MRNILMIDGKPTSDFGVFISGVGTYNAPERDTTAVSVPGRNGDLLIDNGRFHNIEITYPCYIVKEFADKFNAFKNYLLSRNGYFKIEDSYDAEHYRKAFHNSGLVPSVQLLHRVGAFEITFNCNPQRFLKSGEDEIELTSSGVIYNPTLFRSKPLIRAYGTGYFYIGGIKTTITTADGYTDIDCEIMDCFKGSTNCNGNVSCDDFENLGLEPGDNNITMNGITKLIITPRFWEI